MFKFFSSPPQTRGSDHPRKTYPLSAQCILSARETQVVRKQPANLGDDHDDVSHKPDDTERSDRARELSALLRHSRCNGTEPSVWGKSSSSSFSAAPGAAPAMASSPTMPSNSDRNKGESLKRLLLNARSCLFQGFYSWRCDAASDFFCESLQFISATVYSVVETV